MTAKVGDKRICQICGKEFEITQGGWTRKYCYECSPYVDRKDKKNHAKNMNIKRRAIKEMLIKEAGGKCVRCGYNKSIWALSFHHTDPTQKDFGIFKQINRNLDDLRAEAAKCILVCMNCHAEIHEELAKQGFDQNDEF